MRASKKLVTVASLAVAPLIGGVAGVTVTALPTGATHAHTATFAAHRAAAEVPDPGDGQSEAADPGEQQTPEADNPGGHQDTPGANTDHQFSGVE
jgi:hypothetical protein